MSSTKAVNRCEAGSPSPPTRLPSAGAGGHRRCAARRFYPPAVRAAVTQLLIARERHGVACSVAWNTFQVTGCRKSPS